MKPFLLKGQKFSSVKANFHCVSPNEGWFPFKWEKRDKVTDNLTSFAYEMEASVSCEMSVEELLSDPNIIPG